MRYLALSARPINKRTIWPKVVEILRAKGRTTKQNTVSRTWIHNFYEKHCADLKTGRGVGLDPKRVKAFNFTTVDHHFNLLEKLLEEHGIPWENVYNMDEKGIQLG
ncbi:hypothetical protein K435DRAFT_679980 [Dendrothele bispora CBS 962.96]|uniref:HTH CENPB-type domain-containing protein n=1 Tax=Dendrothele bispora (strain CBS 962.96) TaxID=1314807 RepID=A0A4V4HDT6_DENBC|nr:hypothetical protein K435DRAFT_679980 [Dendrothele bispora CBS 962.96]